MRRSLAFLAFAVMLAACSSGAPRATSSGTSPSSGATPSVTASGTGTAGGTPASSARATSGGVQRTAPTPAAATHASVSTPPRAGTYRYAQDGSTDFSGSTFPSEKSGTLAIDAPTTSSDGEHQHQTRTYGSDRSREQALIFRSTGIYLQRAVEHIGFGQSVTCAPSKPVLVIKLPFDSGSWSDAADCDGEHISVSGKVDRSERRAVGSASVQTYVISETIAITGSQYSSTSHETMWVSPDYRLIVRTTEDTNGSYGGAKFTRHFTEDLQDLTPA